VHWRRSYLLASLFIGLAIGLFVAAYFGAAFIAPKETLQDFSDLPSHFSVGSLSTITPEQYGTLVNDLLGVGGVRQAELRSNALFTANVSASGTLIDVYGIPNQSLVYSGITIVNGTGQLGQLGTGQVYMWNRAPNASRFHVGDVLPGEFSFYSYSQKSRVNVARNFTIAGVVNINLKSIWKLIDGVITNLSPDGFGFPLVLANWSDAFPSLLSYNPVTKILVYADSSGLVDSGLETSLARADHILNGLTPLASKFNFTVASNLTSSLEGKLFTLQRTRSALTTAALVAVSAALYIALPRLHRPNYEESGTTRKAEVLATVSLAERGYPPRSEVCC
jgi:hypothetical protein